MAGHLPESLREELRAALLAPRPGSAEALAERFGVTQRTVVRERARLRAAGLEPLVATPEGDVRAWTGRALNCERCADRRATTTVNGWDVCERCEAKERARTAVPTAPHLPVGPVEPMAADERFRCEKYRCELAAGACVRRQVEPMARGSQAWMKRPKYPYCAAECAQGRLIKLRLGKDFAPDHSKEKARIAGTQAAKARIAAATRDVPPAPAPTPITSPPPAQPVSPPAQPDQEQHMAHKNPLESVTDDQIKEALAKGGSIAATAKALGTTWPTLKARVEKLEGAKAKAKPRKHRHPKAVAKSAVTTSVPKDGPGTPTEGDTEPDAESDKPVTFHHVELPPPEQLQPGYLLACVRYARSFLRDLAGALDEEQPPNRSAPRAVTDAKVAA